MGFGAMETGVIFTSRMTASSKLQIGIIEDNNSLREGLARYFDLQDEFTCSMKAVSVEDCLIQMKREGAFAPDVLLLDINLPGVDGTTGIPSIRKQMPSTDIIMLTINNDSDYVFKALCNGAVGYVLKGTPLAKIKEAIQDVKQGGSAVSPAIARKMIEYFRPGKEQKNESRLTDKELQVVQCLVDGLSYKMCADRLNVKLETIRFHIKNIYRKLQVNSKSEVVKKSLFGEI
jgi:DNA-binding NarL/FixJ family response regulator